MSRSESLFCIKQDNKYQYFFGKSTSVTSNQNKKNIIVLDDKIHVMSRRTLGRRLTEVNDDAKTKLTKSFKSVEYLASTADVWSTKHRSFLGVTVHYVRFITVPQTNIIVNMNKNNSCIFRLMKKHSSGIVPFLLAEDLKVGTLLIV